MKKFILALLSSTVLFSCQPKEEKKNTKPNNEVVDVESKSEDSLINSKQIASFPSSDGILINVDIYEISKNAPVILLCHQARFNKTEYKDIAPKLNALGFNCIAIDQRSGGELNDSMNITNQRAVIKNLPVDYLDAEKDIIASIDFAYEKYGSKIILWGSSYSSTLALWIGKNNDKVEAVISFSPGDYFEEKGSLTNEMKNFTKPFWVTSSLEEEKELTAMLSKMKRKENQIQFIPKGKGEHGSRALWKESPDHQEYWESLIQFLKQFK